VLPTRRLLVAGAAVLLLAAGGATAWRLTRTEEAAPPGDPVWVGAALRTDRGTATELVVTEPGVAAERAGAQVLGAPDAAFTKTTSRLTTVYTAGDVTVRVRDGKPRSVSGSRGPAPGDAPSEEVAIERATEAMRAFGLDPAEWKPTARTSAGLRTVQFTPKSDLPIFATQGVMQPWVSMGLDGGGVRSFLVTLTRLAPRQVAIRSQQEAWADVGRAGRYDTVRLVLVDRGEGVIAPHWEFATTDGKKVPVRAVLTS
jgi:hypothetical protein